MQIGQFFQTGREYGFPLLNMNGTKDFTILVADCDSKFSKYDETWLYYIPGRFHPLYRNLVQNSALRNRIKLFTHLNDI
jgi:hypothetical protein